MNSNTMSRSYAVELSRTSALRPQGNSPQRAVRLRSRRCHRIRTHSTDQNDEQENIPKLEQSDQVDQTSNSRRGRKADSTDAIASALTRRFGLAGGLAWLGFLTFGVVSEQIKTRLEVASEQAQTKDVSNKNVQTIPGFPGVEYYDERVGGGAFPRPGDLVILSFRGYANGELFVDTYDSQKPIVFLYKSRPFTGGVCPGYVSLSCVSALSKNNGACGAFD